MAMHQQDYTGLEYVDKHAEDCAKKGTDALLDLLCEHHPEQCPEAAAAFEWRKQVKLTDVPPPATIVAIPSEEQRITEWVKKQKALLPPRLRDWNFEADCPSISTIQRAVCEKYKITRTDMVSIRRTKRVVTPRQIAIYLARKLTTRSLPYIGGKFGGRDHTTCLHAVKKVTDWIERDKVFAAEMEALQQVIAEA
jgi:hypothetical protein